MNWILLISVAFLLLIGLSDIKARQIPIVLLLGETVISFCLGYHLIGTLIMMNTLTNFAIIGFQMLILWVWIKIKTDKTGESLWSKFGKGDLFMLAILAINLSALNYLFLTIIVSSASIILWLGISTIRKIKDQTIPFAGFLAAGLMIIRILQMTGDRIVFYSDSYIFKLF
jgi:hypothetical protein